MAHLAAGAQPGQGRALQPRPRPAPHSQRAQADGAVAGAGAGLVPVALVVVDHVDVGGRDGARVVDVVVLGCGVWLLHHHAG